MFFTVAMFLGLGPSNTSAFETFLDYVAWFVVGMPFATYYYILLGIVSETYQTAGMVKLLGRLPWRKLTSQGKLQRMHRLGHSALYPIPFVVASCVLGYFGRVIAIACAPMVMQSLHGGLCLVAVQRELAREPEPGV